MSQHGSDGNRQLVLLCAGAGACFLAGWSAHAVYNSRQRPAALPDGTAGSGNRQQLQGLPPRVSLGGTPSVSPSAASTPRDSTAASVSDANGFKMALLVRADIGLGKGRAAVLCSHGALQQYKKVYRRRDPARLEWEESGSKKLCLAVQGAEAMANHRQAAKAQGVPTYLVSDRHATGSPESIVLVIGPAPGNVMDSILGDLKLLD